MEALLKKGKVGRSRVVLYIYEKRYVEKDKKTSTWEVIN